MTKAELPKFQATIQALITTLATHPNHVLVVPPGYRGNQVPDGIHWTEWNGMLTAFDGLFRGLVEKLPNPIRAYLKPGNFHPNPDDPGDQHLYCVVGNDRVALTNRMMIDTLETMLGMMAPYVPK